MTPINAIANQGTPKQGQSNSGPQRAGDSAKRAKWLRHSSSRSPLAPQRRSRGSITRKNDDDLPRKSNLPARSLQIDTIKKSRVALAG